MRLAFYAPMKPPDHAVPSGDRAIAQALIAALEYTGAEVTLASRLQTRDGKGEAQSQSDLFDAAEAEVARLVPVGRRAGWQAWITYHNYYKAPDLVGPAVAQALDIAYIQIESTRARKRLDGPWARFAEAAEQATDVAAAVFYFSSRDAEALRRDAPATQQLIHLRPFLARTSLPPASALKGSILSVGMMRAGDKMASYQIIAETLALMGDTDWHLEIAGDGPARGQVVQLMVPFGSQVQFLGQLSAEDLHAAYARNAVFFWPGVNEALGMVYLEAQAAGLPIVAQDRPGMRVVLAPTQYPTPKYGTAPLAQRLADLLGDTENRQSAGTAARAFVGENHLLPQAAQTLMSGLNAVGVRA